MNPYDSFDMEAFNRRMEAIDKRLALKDAEFERLRIEPSCKVPVVGDVVVVAAGLIGRGHDWVRKECLVVAVGETSVKVRFGEKKFMADGPDDEWVSPILITDVIPKGDGEPGR